jgi:hypothetical protein
MLSIGIQYACVRASCGAEPRDNGRSKRAIGNATTWSMQDGESIAARLSLCLPKNV